jgi:hypothetical protein
MCWFHDVSEYVGVEVVAGSSDFVGFWLGDVVSVGFTEIVGL